MRGLGLVFRPLSIVVCLVSLSCTLRSQTKVEPSHKSLNATDNQQQHLGSGRTGFSLEDLPLQFEENQGQADPRARFLARGRGYTLLLNSDGLALNLAPGRKYESSKSVSMRLLGAQESHPVGREQSATRTNYYIGKSPSDWHLNVPSYHFVMYPGLYKGIDLIYHGNGNQLEYDFVVSPGADPDQVQMRFDGLTPTLRGSDLSFEGETGFTVGGLKAFQMIHGVKKPVEVSWQLQGDRASIHVGPYDRQQQLVIDPVFFYGAYIGGNLNDAAISIVQASQPGYFYVALSTDSSEIVEPSQLPGNSNCGQKGCPTNTLILGLNAINAPAPPSPFPPYSSSVAPVPSLVVGSATYVGGATGITVPTGMVADSSTNLYLTGTTTNGSNFPQLGSQICSQSCNGFVAKLATSLDTSSGSGTVTLQYSFGLPATPNAIAVDTGGDAYITGSASTTPGDEKLTIPSSDITFQNQVALGTALTSGTHAFLLELDPSGATLFCSYIGGSSSEQGNAIAVSGNSVFIAGQTSSSDFPTTSGAAQKTYGGGTQDAFAFAASGLSASPALVYSTYLGGSDTDSAFSIAAATGSPGNVVVAGSTKSSQFPIQASPSFSAQAWQVGSQPDGNGGNFATPPTAPPTLVNLPTAVPQGDQDAFVTSLSANGGLLFTDFLGGDADTSTSTSAQALALDSLGTIYVTGTSTATGFTPTTGRGQFLGGSATEDLPGQASYTGVSNVFFAEIDPSGLYLLQATLAGGPGTDLPGGLSISSPLASAGVASIVGVTTPPLSTQFQNPDLFLAASQSTLNPVNPTGPAKNDITDSTAFFVQEALAGFCSMQLTKQVGTTLTFSGPCVSGTQSGTVFATAPSSAASIAPITAPISVVADGNSLVGTATLNLSPITGNQSFNITFAFLPLGAIGGVGTCEITGSGTGISGCGITTSGGGGGTLFNVSTGTLTISLTCTPASNCIPVGGNSPNSYYVLPGSPVTLGATLTNSDPNTVTWGAVNTPQGTLIPPSAPSTSATFTPGLTGGPTVITATSAADGTTKANLTLITLETPTLTLAVNNTGTVSYGQTITVNVGATGLSSIPTGPFTYVVDGGTSTNGTLTTGGVATITLPQLGAGNHDIRVTFPSNYQTGGLFTTATKTLNFTIAPATLTVQATNASVDFGQDIPALSYTITGFQYGDSQSTIGGAPTETTTATKGSPVGQYPITITQGTLGTNSSVQNYTFVFQNGTLTITSLGAVPQPLISLPSGTYTAAQTVTITDSLTGATIYFTTDGSAPTANSTVYGGPISVSKSETIQAVANAPGHSLSAITSAVYVLAPPTLSTTSLDFGSVVQGQASASQAVTLTNQGKNALAGVGVAIAGTNAGDFTAQPGSTCAGSLQTGASCTFTITFTPSGTGSRSAILTVSYTGIGTPQTVTLVGSGVGPVSIVTPPSQLVAGTTYQFIASEPVTWTASAGTITSSGLFTAPNPPPNPPTVTITATSLSNPQFSVTSQVTISPAPAITVPTGITLGTGSTTSIPLSISAGTGVPGELLAFACTPATLPTGISCTFTPNPVVNASGGTTVTLNLASTPINSMAAQKQQAPWKKFPLGGSVVLAACCLLFGSRRFRQGRMLALLLCMLTSVGLMYLTACGTGGSFSTKAQEGFATGTYEIKVTVTGATPGSPDYNQVVTIFSVNVSVQ